MSEMLKISLVFLAFLPMLALSACQANHDKWSIPLDGEWEILKDDSSDPFSEDQANQWKKVTLPCAFDLVSRQNPSGFFWLRRNFTVTDEVPKLILFQAGEIMNSDEVYLNGMLIGKTGSPPPNFRSGWGKMRSYPISTSQLKTENTIHIRVYYDSEVWIHPPLELIDVTSGSRRQLLSDFLLIHLLHAFSFLLLFIAAFFSLLYWKRRSEKSYFIFSILSFLASVTLTVQYYEHIYGAIPYNSNTVFKITQCALLFMAPMISLFFHYYSTQKPSQARKLLTLVLPGIASLVILLSPTRYDILAARKVFLAIYLLIPIDLSIQLIKLFRKDRHKGFFMALAIAPVFILGTRDILAFGFGFFRMVMYFAYAFPALVIIVSVHLATRFARSLGETEELNQTLNQRVAERTAELQNRNTAIMESISYARLIQTSLLPSDQEINRIVREHISLWKPRDTVGGDFFWCQSNGKGRGWLAVGDCTGHGVPGALMSMMATSLLDREASAHDPEKPENVLATIHTLTLESMHRNSANNVIRDGFDIILVYVDSDTRRLHAAGAHLGLYLLPANGKPEYYPGSSRGIGQIRRHGHTRFDSFSIQTSPGDTIYLLSDGLLDQNGGERNFSYGRHRFLRLLESLRNIQLSKQVAAIETDLQDYAAGNKQRDDMVMLAFRI